MQEAAVVEAPDVSMAGGGNEIWVEALPARIYHTPQYGPVEITRDKLQRFVHHFNNRVRGQDVATDFDHGMDRAKGNQASGWYKELALKPSLDDPTNVSLFARIELTDDARKELKDKKWRYFSLEWEDEWQDNQGQKWTDVITGGGFTNRPIAKNMMPINFSEAMWEELDYETKKQFAVWTTAFVNDLPDSAFLYVQPGGSKDGEGKTKPRSLRHFPYKGSDGKVDLPHLRNAIARIPQAGSWLNASLKTSLQSRARKMLGGTSMSEVVQQAYDILVAEGYDIKEPATTDAAPEAPEAELVDTETDDSGNTDTDTTEFSESKEWEHSEPGSGNPPAPKMDAESGISDISITQGWRRESPPAATEVPPQVKDTDPNTNDPRNRFSEESKEGRRMSELTVEQQYELRNILGIPADGDVIEAARLQLGELTELKRTVDAASQERKFAEEYPAFWNEHNKLMDRDRGNAAKAFSESVSRVRKAEGFGLKETAKGLSQMSLQKITDLHKHFSEGTASLEEFEDCIRTVVNGGIVEFGEIGSSTADDVPIVDTTTSGGIVTARKLFAEVVSKVQADHPEMDYVTAMNEAAKKHPDLAEAYSVALPG